ncbi:MAG: Slp family lipoprotein [Vibrio sp.]
MKTMRSAICVLTFLGCLIITGCAQLPNELRSPASVDVVTDYTSLVTLSKGPSTDVATARLGGVIASIDNQAKQTRLVLVSLPIERGGRPDISHEPQGRFVVYVNRFLDPITYRKGRLLTVLGTSKGTESIMVGEHSQSVPVIHAQGVHLWTIKQRVLLDGIAPVMSTCRGWMCPYMDPSNGQIIKTVE